MNLTQTIKQTVLVLAVVCPIVSCSTNVAQDEAEQGRLVQKNKAERPNIIVIIADDMGFSDLGRYGGEIDTPNIDSLAASGVRFSQFYNTSRCSPTRASLLTGRYPHKVQMGHLAGNKYQSVDGYRGDLDSSVKILPEVLAQFGYRNYIAGKWHVGAHEANDLKTDDISALENTPLKRGFDEFYGTLLGGNNYFDPKYLFRNNDAIQANSDDYYYTDAISREAVGFINQHVVENKEQPFFLYMAYTAPHWPIQAPAQTIAKYRERYQQGWDQLRQQRYERLLKEGLIDVQWPLSQRDELVSPWQDEENKAWQGERMAVHAAMVDHLDQGVGTILRALENNKILDNTLIVFLSDNGGSAEDIPVLADNSKFKAMLEKVADKYKPRTDNTMHVGNTPELTSGSQSVLQSIGPEWANLSNTPFRKYKSRIHEGGIAAPLIVTWPNGLSKNGLSNGTHGIVNSIVQNPSHVIDIMMTLLDAADIAVEPFHTEANRFDGVSLLPLLQGRAGMNRAALFFEHEGHRAVRGARWKLLAARDEPWELYDMREDRTETNNVATMYPERVQMMVRQYDNYAQMSKVKPWAEVSAQGRK